MKTQLQDKVSQQETLLNVYRESEKSSGGYGAASPSPERVSLEDFLAKISGAKGRIRTNEARRLSVSQQKDAVPHLVQMWRNGNETQRYNALAVLNHMGESSIVAFVEGTISDDDMIRWKALSALGDTKTKSPLALEAVRRAHMEDENPKLRIEAAKTLWVLTGDQRAVDTIISFLDDPSLDVQKFALNAFHEKAISREAGAKAVPISGRY